MFSPGHTLASITYIVGDAALTHDTIFMPDGGTARADFPGGSAGAFWHSIERIMAPPGEARLLMGHDTIASADAGPAGKALSPGRGLRMFASRR